MRVVSCSFSSDKKLARCEQQFSYRYDERLKVRVKSKGLYMGDWMHQLYEAHYRRRMDAKSPKWEVVFKRLKKEMWDNLFDEEREKYTEDGFTPQLAYDLISHYIEYWEPQERNWKIIQVEQAYEMPTKFGFPVRWKSDLLVQDGKYMVMVETKNKKEIPESDERVLNPQVHSYAWLLGKKGVKVDSILWNYIRTTPVTRPQVLKDGSLSERKINTDRRTYLLAMKEAKIHPKGDEIIGVENYLKTLPETLSLARVTNTPNLPLGEKFVRDWVERHRRAQLIDRPLRNFGRDCDWSCDYKNLCMADLLDKVDRNGIIKRDFTQITDRDGEELK